MCWLSIKTLDDDYIYVLFFYIYQKKTLLNLGFVFILTAFCSYGQAQNFLTNDDIIKLSKAGISKAIILTKIEMEPNKFDLSSDGLVNWKRKEWRRKL